MSDRTHNSSTRINGWKDIANHLRRSPRTAQRYEEELGMPVHRLGTGDGQTVYAYSEEIDEWLRTRETKLGVETDSAGPDSDLAPPESAVPTATGRQAYTTLHPATRQEIEAWRKGRDAPDRPQDEAPGSASAEANVQPFSVLSASGQPNRRRWPFLVTLAAVLVLGIGAWWVRTAAKIVTIPDHFEMVGASLEALDANNRLIWSHRFDSDISPLQELNRFRRSDVPTVDLAGDGTTSMLISVRFATQGQKPSLSDALVAFSLDGQIRWSVSLTQTLTCGTESFGDPWQISAVTVSTGPWPRRVWVAFSHNTWWPSLVFEVDAVGQKQLRYVQAGWVMSLADWATPSGPVLAVGGVDNDRSRPVLALVDETGPPEVLPTGDRRFSCTNVPVSHPRQVYLFPNDELNTSL